MPHPAGADKTALCDSDLSGGSLEPATDRGLAR
jgi:hypothetical protein